MTTHDQQKSGQTADARTITTPPCRLHFPALFEPKETMKGNGDLQFQATILIPPSVDMQPFAAAIEAAMQEKFGRRIPLEGRGMPLKTCASKNALREAEGKQPFDGFEDGWRFLRVKSKNQPTIVDEKVQQLLDQSRIYPGVWCRFNINAYGWQHSSGIGVSFGLNMVQLIKGDTELRVGGPSQAPTDAFAPVEVQADTFEGGAPGGDVAPPPADDPLAGLL